MDPTSEELADAVFLLGTEDELTDEISQDVLDRLAELGMVHLEVDAAPQLTEYGEKTFTAIEAGDPVPEFDEPE